MTTEPNAYVWVTPARRGGEPCIGGTRIDTAMVANFARDHDVNGDGGVAQAARNWDLSERQVWIALWYEATYGELSRVRKWRRWAAGAHRLLCDDRNPLPDESLLPNAPKVGVDA